MIVQSYNTVGLGQQGKNHAYPATITGAIQRKGNPASGNEAGTIIVASTLTGGQRGGASHGKRSGADRQTLVVAPALTARQNRLEENQAYIFETRIGRNGRGQPSKVCHALRGHEAGGSCDSRPCLLSPGSTVRRLTPLECLRLMGAPDSWLDLDPPLSDSAKYRLCGNGVVVPIARWLGSRIARYCGRKEFFL